VETVRVAAVDEKEARKGGPKKAMGWLERHTMRDTA
jgi:hypothetical protein